MKRQAFVILTTFSLVVMLAAVSVYAQSDARLQVNIPFEFSVWNTRLPAGEYTVSQLVQNAQNILLIRRFDCTASTAFITIPTRTDTTPHESKLVFNRYGDQYFLSKVWTAGQDSGRELSKSRAEREVIQVMSASTKSSSQPQTVSVVIVGTKR